MTKLASSSQLSQWRMPSARNRQLLSFSTSTVVRSTPTKMPEPLFRRNPDKKVMAGSAARVAPLICLKCFLRAALRCKSARLKPPSRLDCLLVWRNGDKAQGRRASSWWPRGAAKRKGSARRWRAQARDRLEVGSPSPRQKSSADGDVTEGKEEKPIRIWQCVRNKEVRRFRASSNG